MNIVFDSIESALKDIKQGKILIVVDDEARENEGDFLMAAELCTPDTVNFMIREGRGILCASITEDRANKLYLDHMVKNNTSSHATPFTVSVDLIEGTSTGVSSIDRAKTIRALVDEKTRPEDLARPGHIFPLIANRHGVLVRPGHTEAAVDLSRLAGLTPCGVICEILNEDGTVARLRQLKEIALKHNMKMVSIQDLIKYRKQHEVLYTETSVIDFPCKYGHFKLHTFQSLMHKEEYHLAFVKGQINPDLPALVRIHSECATGDIFGSKRCDCGDQLQISMKMIEKQGSGVLVYLKQEGRGIGLINKMKAYNLQDQGLDTVEANHALGFKADQRDYAAGAQILKSLGVKKVRLLTNNPQKFRDMKFSGIEVVERISIEIEPNDYNFQYLMAKRDKLGHMILGNDGSVRML